MKIITLSTCHNRKKLTLNSLQSINNQVFDNEIILENIIVDDGCTDGTSFEINKKFPSTKILRGNGGLYWAGGMRYGWNEYIKHQEFDYLYVYNDDVELFDDSINKLIKSSIEYKNKGVLIHAVVGSFKNKETQITTYGGLVRSSHWHPLRFKRIDPDEASNKEVDVLNMNGCLIPIETLKKIGFLSDYFVHNGADFEFGLKVKKNNGINILCPTYIGHCERNPLMDEFTIDRSSLLNSYKKLLSIKNEPLLQRHSFYKEHAGMAWFILFIIPYLTLPIKYLLAKMNK